MLPPNETVFLSAYKDMVQTRKAYEVTMDIMRKDVEGGFPYDGHKVTTALESFNFLERKMECAERDWMEVVEALEKQWAEEVDYNEWVTAETKTALALLK